MLRFRNIISKDKILKFYKTFIHLSCHTFIIVLYDIQLWHTQQWKAGSTSTSAFLDLF